MYSVTEREAPSPTFVLRDEEAGSAAEVVPARGAIASRFQVKDTPVIAYDDALYRQTKGVRGGVPVLFPIAGKLQDDRYSWGGATYAMPQHGFARSTAWDVQATSTDGAASLTLATASTDATRASFPFDFAAQIVWEVAGPALTFRLRVENRSAEAMPMQAGIHPYFVVPDREKAETSIATGATRAWDNVAKKDGAFRGFDLTQGEVDLHLADHGPPRSRITYPSLPGAIEIDASPEFRTWVVWTLAGRDFVCVEPWTAPGNALNTSEHLIRLEPGGRIELAVEIRLAP